MEIRRKCQGFCNQYHTFPNGQQRYCDSCKKIIKGRKRKMPEKKLMTNNKKGFNRYKKNAEKKVEVVKPKTINELIEERKTTFKEYWRTKRKMLSLAQLLSQIDNQLFDLKNIKQSVEEELMEEERKKLL